MARLARPSQRERIMKEKSNQRNRPATFVIVHGAWGSWAWLRVADRLIAKGHRVYAPTLSGLGGVRDSLANYITTSRRRST